MTKPQSMLHSCHSSKMQFKSLQVKQLPTNQAGDQSALICKFDDSHCWYAAACDSSVSLDASLGAHAVQSTSPSPYDENSRTLQNPAYRHTTLLVRCSMSGRCTKPSALNVSHIRASVWVSMQSKSVPPGVRHILRLTGLFLVH